MPDTEKKLTEIEDYKLETASDIEPEVQSTEFRVKIKLTSEQEDEIAKIIDTNLETIEAQRSEDDSENRWKECDNQYWGIVRDNPNMLFNLHTFLTLKHVRRAKSRIYQAFFESDPIFSVSSRPGELKKDGHETAELQEQFLDYELDSEVIVKSPMRKVLHQASLKDGGIAKVIWERDTEWTTRKELYEGNKIGLNSFLENYPDAREKYPHYVKQLEEGKDINLVVNRKTIVYDAPKIYFVDFKDFYIDLTTEGIFGLRKAKFHAELQRYNWYDLQEEIEEDRFDKDKVDALCWTYNENNQLIMSPDYLSKEYEIFEVNMFYKLGNSKKPKRITVWYSRDKKKILNVIYFIYEHGRPYYIPFFITEEAIGWHQPGLGRILQPQNIIANSASNFLLENAFYRQTPLLRATPNTTIATQLLAKTWKIGDPLVAERGEVEKFDLNTGNLTELVALIRMNDHQADEASGVGSPYMSGRADPTDPDAPAAKAMALLHESNINIKDFILCLSPSFQELAYQLLQLFAQFRGTTQFKLKKKDVLGEEEIFNKITAEQLRLRTNIVPNAYAFSFDKLNEKRENLALATFLTSNPMAQQFLARAPKAQWNLFNILIKSWSDFWNTKVSEIFPTLEEVDKYLIELQKKSFEQFYQQKVKEAQQRMMGAPVGPTAPPMGTPEEMPVREEESIP